MTTALFSAEHHQPLRDLLLRDYGLQGELHALPGERDLNLRLRTAEHSMLVKVAAADRDPADVALQVDVLEHLADVAPELPVQRVRRTTDGTAWCELHTTSGQRLVWVTSWLDGQLLAHQASVDASLCQDLGRQLARLDRALQSFDANRAQRELKWDLLRSGWIGGQLHAIADPELRAIVTSVHEQFVTSWLKHLTGLRRGVLHNDANDHNLLGNGTSITGVLDFGDLCHSALVGEVAIASTYAAMLADDPLAAIDAVVRGYDAELPLTDGELLMVLPLIETRLAVSITNAAVQQRARPDDPYVTVSLAGAARLIRWLHGRDRHVAATRLRMACGRPADPVAARIATFVREPGAVPAAVFDAAVEPRHTTTLDLSFGSLLGGDDPTNFDAALADQRIAAAMRAAGATVGIGRYAEPRPIYTERAFGGDEPNGRRRTVHLGIDAFVAAGTTVHVPLAGEVHVATVCDAPLDYGGLVVVRHVLPDGTPFGTLYGHLDPASIAGLRPGARLAAGTAFARVGAGAENGGWPPHLHLQLLAADPYELPTVPRGVADPDDLAAHLAVYPDPSGLLGLPGDSAVHRDDDNMTHGREQHFAANLRTSYREPIALQRGWRHFVFDRQGRRLLDAYNNVPHVGHCHPRVTRAIHEQTALLATNTRYLHDGMQRYAARLQELLPAALSVFFFTPSGSEANELALRLVRAHTGAVDLCVMDHGYHGHTTATMAMSPYKFRQRGAPKKASWVHVTAQPDVYRGEFTGVGAGARFAARVVDTIRTLQNEGTPLAGYLCECLPSVGGQLELPDGFLLPVYDAVREAGGLCIADDVQTALWRTGSHAFGFERHAVVPDVLVLGKPLGNGFPLGAVVTTPAIAASFARGPEFFSTFGGSTVAMAAGLAVLDVLRDEGLAANAKRVGDRLVQGLRELQRRHAVIGDVRGRGFFLGVELVDDPTSKQPATATAAAVTNRLRERRVLIGTDGPFANVLKIRPPMTFDAAAADCLLDELDRALGSCR